MVMPAGGVGGGGQGVCGAILGAELRSQSLALFLQAPREEVVCAHHHFCRTFSRTRPLLERWREGQSPWAVWCADRSMLFTRPPSASSGAFGAPGAGPRPGQWGPQPGEWAAQMGRGQDSWPRSQIGTRVLPTAPLPSACVHFQERVSDLSGPPSCVPGPRYPPQAPSHRPSTHRPARTVTQGPRGHWEVSVGSQGAGP